MAIDTKTFVRGVAVWLTAVAAAFALTFFGFSHASSRLPVDLPAPSFEAGGGSVGMAYPAPDFRLATLEGETFGPPDLLGQVVVIDLWASWCGPCRLQAEFLEQLHGEYQGKGVRFLAINSQEDETTVRAYVTNKPFPYPVLLDPRGSVKTLYRSSGLPTVMVIDRGGRVSFLRVGVADVATLRGEIEKALAAPAQPTA